jgi:hypothetical protein
MSAEAPASGQLDIPRGAEANVGRAEPRRIGSAKDPHLALRIPSTGATLDVDK